MPSDSTRVQELLKHALTLADDASVQDYLNQVCGDNASLKAEIEQLLIAQRQPSIDLPSPASTLDRPLSMATGEHIPGAVTPVVVSSTKKQLPSDRVIAGRYTLLEIIGEGGMGAVYLAEQTEPVKRQVALKLIKSGMDSKGVLARFDAERQALALMDHPNIARIYDGGVTPSGQPFFVMELVKGVPLTEYCDTQRLSVQSRLELFVQVCQAVQHAHQKGIIHRDLKPGNVLVTEVDGRPTPKVIDFGVAKATEQNLTDMSFADTGLIVGTPAYMSPEQADPNSMDIDTRTDVYALGVILYELLAGSPPIDAKQFKRGAILEMLRMVREVDPPRPSTKLSTADALPNIAANRNIEPGRLAKLLKGELDWVVMKALEKDRTRRYETANGLARDIQRYLADEVVEARPPSRGYRLRKFVRRNKGQVIAASLVLCSLLAGILGTTLGLLRARQQEGLAVKARDEAESNAVAEAKARIRAEAITKFVTKALNASDPMLLGNKNTTIAQAMTNAIAEIEAGAFKADPETEAELKDTIGLILRNNGKLEQARTLLEQALEIRERIFTGDHAGTALSLHNVGSVLVSLGRFDLAGPILERSRAMFERIHGPDHPDVAALLNNLGTFHYLQEQFDKAEPWLKQALAVREKVLSPDHRDLALTLNDLALLYSAQGRFTEAEPLLKRALAIYEKTLGPDHPDVAAVLNSLATTYDEQAKYALAEEPYLRALAIIEKALGPDHPIVATALHNLADNYRLREQYAKAEPMFKRSLAIREKAHGPEHEDVAVVLNNLAMAYRAQGRYAEAEPLLLRCLAMDEKSLGPEHPDVATDLHNLAGLYDAQKQYAKAEPLFTRALAIREQKLGQNHQLVGATLNNLARMYQSRGEAARAEPLAVRAVAIFQKTFPAAHPNVAHVLATLAQIQDSLGKTAEARRGFDQALGILRKHSPEVSVQLAVVLMRSAQSRINSKQPGELPTALRELEEAVVMVKVLPPDHPTFKEIGDTLTRCREAMGTKLPEGGPLPRDKK
jgi:eukaryotic-like serine/threonine-protein kinase